MCCLVCNPVCMYAIQHATRYIRIYAIQSGHPACYQACHRLTTTQTNVLKTNAALYLSDLKFHFDFSFGKSDNGAGQHAVHLARLILFCSGHFANVMGKDDAKNLVENEMGGGQLSSSGNLQYRPLLSKGGTGLSYSKGSTGLVFSKGVTSLLFLKGVTSLSPLQSSRFPQDQRAVRPLSGFSL